MSNFITETTYSNLNLIFVDESNVRSKPTQFTYGNASFGDFCKARAEDGNEWLGRKIVALPKFFVIMPIKIAFHSAMSALFFVAGESREAKVFTYYLIRDFEEALGHLIVVFNDNLGSYLLQESIYQKECYDLSLLQPDAKNEGDQWLDDIEKVPSPTGQRIKSDSKLRENERKARVDEIRKQIEELENDPNKGKNHQRVIEMYRNRLEEVKRENAHSTWTERQILERNGIEK